MKKLLAIVLCLAMCLGILAVTATAATTYSVAGAYIAPGSSTQTPGVFGQSWAPAYAANKMTSTGTNTYSITYKNAPAGEYQFKVTDGSWSNCWGGNGPDGNYVVTLEAACDLTINFNSSTKKITHEASSAVAPEETETIKVHAKVPASWTKANAYAWGDSGSNQSWPGAAMTKGADGWYTIEVPAWVKNIIINNGSAQTQDMALPAADEVWIVVTGTKGTIYTTNPDGGAEPEPEKTIKVHAQVPASWTKANAYAWSDSGSNQAWPGAAMTKGADGWYTIEVPAWAKNIIINNGSAQTQDMAFPAADEVWIVVEGTKGTIYTTKPEAGTQPEIPELKIDSVGIRGDDTKFSAVNWNNDVKMTKTGEEGYGVWEYTFKNVAAGTRPTIKFTTNGGWDLNFGCEDANVGATSGTAHKGVHNGGDLWFEVKELSDVHIKLDLSKFNPADNTGATYTITVTAVETEETDPSEDPTEKPTQPEPTGTIIVHAQVPADWTAAYVYTWATGSNGDPAWPGAAMEKDADGWFTLAIPSNVDNIIINNGAGSQTQDMTLSGAAEIWITVEAADNGFIGTIHEENPKTADGMDLIAVCTAMLLAGAAAVVVAGNKKRFF